MAEIMVALSSDDQTISVPLATVFGTGIARIEQTVTSEDPEIPNEITCTLTNGQQSKFYIRNGKDGYSPSITIEQGAEGYSITVTDEEGSHEYSIIVDSTLDAESANPIQNQAVAGAVTQLTSDIAAEVTRATNAESAIRTEASQIYATINALNAASSALHDEVTGEYARATAVEEVFRTATTNNATAISTETSRAQAEEARIEGLTADTVKYTEQTLYDYQQRQARANIGAGSKDAVDDAMDMVTSLRRALYDETDRATQAESSISASIPTSAQISALAPVQSVNGQTGAVTIPTATTSADGLMSSQDKSRLDDLYADYSSALTALGV